MGQTKLVLGQTKLRVRFFLSLTYFCDPHFCCCSFIYSIRHLFIIRFQFHLHKKVIEVFLFETAFLATLFHLFLVTKFRYLTTRYGLYFKWSNLHRLFSSLFFSYLNFVAKDFASSINKPSYQYVIFNIYKC